MRQPGGGARPAGAAVGADPSLVSAAALARDGALLWAHASPCRMTMRDLSPEFLDDYLAAEGAGDPVLGGLLSF